MNDIIPGRPKIQMNNRAKIPNLSHLRIFELVAADRNASRAALTANRSQPTVTIALRKLEAFIGVTILERGRSGSHPTEAGRMLLTRIQRLFDQIDDALLRPLVGTAFVQPDRLAGMRAKISIASMRGLIAIAESSTLQEAAQAINLSKPSLYRIARGLEGALGKTCFEHTDRGHAANKTGGELARRFRLALREIDYALEEIKTYGGANSLRILIGARRTCAMQALSDAVKEFLAFYPGANVRVADGPYNQLLQDLRHGRIDLLYGALRLPEWADDVREEPLFYDPYSIALRSGHPLTMKTRITLADLAKYDWIMPSSGSPRRKTFEDLFKGHEKMPVNSIETSSLEFQFTMLASSDCITLMTFREARQQIEAGLLTTLIYKGIARRTYDGIAMRKNWQQTAAQKCFIELLRKHACCVGTPLPDHVALESTKLNSGQKTVSRN